MINISIVIPSRNNLKYVQNAYNSIKNQNDATVEVILMDDASTDGTWEWMKSVEGPNTKIYRNNGPERIGHTNLYDIGANMASNDIFGIFHADMIATPNYIKNMVKHLKKGVIVSGTRIEPPLHPGGPEKIVKNFGIEPDEFKTNEFLEFVNNQEIINKDKTTVGVFAPWIIYKNDFNSISGHDKRVFSPMELEDSLHENRILTIIENKTIKLIRFKELFDKYKNLKEIRSDGKEVIDFEKNNISIHSAVANKNGIIGHSQIKKIIRKKNIKKLLKISTTWGETICTEDHSLINKDLTPIKPNELNINTLWKPIKFNDWTRRFYYKTINLNDYILNFNPKLNNNYTDYELPIINNIDHKGTNEQLRNICEFLGFFVAEGSTPVNGYISICNNNINILNYFKEKSISLFGDLNMSLKTSKKENYKDVYVYTKGSVKLSKFMDNLVGINSKNKKVPDFIFNLPHIYQISFLYGYLEGDGYLGSYIQKNNKTEYIKVDKRFIFKRKIFDQLDCKFTTKSDMLASGICYLLRNIFPKLSINLNFDPVKSVYNIFTNKSEQNKKLYIKNYTGPCEYVYDLEMNNYGEHTFIDSLGYFGVHNSDLFNRLLLKNYNFIQSRDAFVYHLTCRGSRFKDGVNIIQKIPLGNGEIWNRSKDSDEYTNLRQIKFREWWRKWHMNVLHDDLMKPIACKRYDIGYIIHNSTPQILNILEPWTDTIYIDLPQHIIDAYINKEQSTSKFNIKNKIKSLTDQKTNNILVEFNGNEFTQNKLNIIENLMFIIENSGEIGEFEYDIFKFHIKSMESYEKNLINSDDPWYLNKLKL